MASATPGRILKMCRVDGAFISGNADRGAVFARHRMPAKAKRFDNVSIPFLFFGRVASDFITISINSYFSVRLQNFNFRFRPVFLQIAAKAPDELFNRRQPRLSGGSALSISLTIADPTTAASANLQTSDICSARRNPKSDGDRQIGKFSARLDKLFGALRHFSSSTGHARSRDGIDKSACAIRHIVSSRSSVVVGAISEIRSISRFAEVRSKLLLLPHRLTSVIRIPSIPLRPHRESCRMPNCSSGFK